MADFGLVTIPTHETIPPAEFGRWAEDHGFESVWFGEHTHIPTSRKTPFPLGGELPECYKQFFDPFIALTAAAAVTKKLKVGTSVCLIPEHPPITLAKTVSCLDRVSNGRFLFGIGSGWNVEEMADHGVAFKDRWKVTRERVLAMREIWTKDVAEFHGQFVNFDPLWCWPKPVQAGGPPVLIGAMSKWAIKRTAEYGNGWFPLDAGYDLAQGLTELRVEADRRGRSMKEFDLSIITAYGLAGKKGLEARIPELMELGFNRILFLIDATVPEKQWPILERYENLIRAFR